MVTVSDKEAVLDFCKNTFSWGDYISEVWDFWIDEGGFFVIRDGSIPIAICHASISSATNNMWIEGIRVHPDFRRQGHAQKLVYYSEKIATNQNCKTSQMLIETNNKNSITLSQKLGYKLKDTWNFYSFTPNETPSKYNVITNIDEKKSKFVLSSNFSYVDSWRWYPVNQDNFHRLNNQKRIVFSEERNSINGLAVFTNSKHFDNTVLVTLLLGNNKGLSNILSYIGNILPNQRIQVLTNLMTLPSHDGLEKKLSFNLVSKNI